MKELTVKELEQIEGGNASLSSESPGAKVVKVIMRTIISLTTD